MACTYPPPHMTWKRCRHVSSSSCDRQYPPPHMICTYPPPHMTWNRVQAIASPSSPSTPVYNMNVSSSSYDMEALQAIASQLELFLYLPISFYLRERQRERETCVYLSQECRLLFLRWLAATNKPTNMQECSAAFLYRHSILA